MKWNKQLSNFYYIYLGYKILKRLKAIYFKEYKNNMMYIMDTYNAKNLNNSYQAHAYSLKSIQ